MQDAHTPIHEIARNVGFSIAAIHQRLRKLGKAKLIVGSKFIINPKVLGYTTMTFVGIHLDKVMNNPDTIKQLQNT